LPFRGVDDAAVGGIIGRRGGRRRRTDSVGSSAIGSRRRRGTASVAGSTSALALGLVLGLAGCGSGAPASAPPTVDGAGPRPAEAGGPLGSGAGCPDEITRIVDPERPAAAEVVLALDFSGSFVATEQSRNRIRTQTQALVEQSVDRGQALRILSFTRSASSAATIVACPSLAARYNNAAARGRKTENLKRHATVAVDAALQAAIATRLTQKQGPGTSIVGGFLAIAESASLVRPGTPRDAVMFSDGEGLDEDAAVDLSGFRSVSLYGVGASAGGSMDTPTAAAAAADWVRWLTDHGAHSPNASTQAMF
jgi:hypothetical protein